VAHWPANAITAGAAYFDLHSTKPDLLAYGLAGYAVLMVVAQLRFVPIYRRLRFVPGFWSFTFSWCAVAISRRTFLPPPPPPPERPTRLRAEIERIAVGEAMSG
jgi:tellurite resistance protein